MNRDRLVVLNRDLVNGSGEGRREKLLKTIGINLGEDFFCSVVGFRDGNNEVCGVLECLKELCECHMVSPSFHESCGTMSASPPPITRLNLASDKNTDLSLSDTYLGMEITLNRNFLNCNTASVVISRLSAADLL